jgi:hypothetical protein
MKEKEINTWKEDFGFNVSTKEDPDLLTYLFNNWIKNETTTPESRESVQEFMTFAKKKLTQNYVTGMEYLDSGIGIVLSNGDRVPFNKANTTYTDPIRQTVSITGDANSLMPNGIKQVDTSAPITGGSR